MPKKPARTYKQRPVAKQAEYGTFRGMSAERVRQAGMAVCADPEDVTDDERDALDEYTKLGGNLWAL
jgi:hypothetical protein